MDNTSSTDRAESLFREAFGRESVFGASAPGRVNLIGEHTDYNAGLVLPVTIPQRCEVRLALRTDDRVRLVTGDAADAAFGASHGEYRLAGETRRGDWCDYVRGCTLELARAGHALRGFDAAVASDVPIGAGLSSSAALEVAILRALREAFELRLDDAVLARLAHAAETGFVGARVGVMDPMAASLGNAESALFIDARSLAWRRVLFPKKIDLVVIDSGVKHSHASGDYNRRREECEQAADMLAVASLRELSAADLPRVFSTLPPLLAKRVRHVVTENERVLAAVDALGVADLRALGELLGASHASLRDDYDVSVPEIEVLVGLACGDADVHGARLTGGGFGGSIVALTRAGAGIEAARRIVEDYGARCARTARVLLPVAE